MGYVTINGSVVLEGSHSLSRFGVGYGCRRELPSVSAEDFLIPLVAADETAACKESNDVP